MLNEIRSSNQDEFRKQLLDISSMAQGYLGLSLLPPSLETELGRFQVSQMSNEVLVDKYSQRMVVFEKLYRFSKEDAPISDIEQKQMQKSLGVLNRLDDYILNHRNPDSHKTLYDRQATVFEDIRDALEKGIKYGSIQLPTGVGKTVLFTEFVEATNVKTLVLVPTLELLDQTEEKFGIFAPGMEVSKISKKQRNYGKQVTVMTFAALISQIKRGAINPDEYDLLILDEEHRSQGQKTQEALSKFTNAIKLGLSATPYEFEGRNVIHNMSVLEAIEEGLLADLNVWWVKTDVQLPKLNEYGKYDERELKKAINIKKRNKAAVDLYIQRFDGTSTFAYCSSVQHAKDLARMFQENGISAEAVWGGMDKNKRKQIISKFKKGQIKILCNNKALREGVDVPRAKLCLRLSPGYSSVDTIQEGGRVLRLFNNETAYIVEFIDEEFEGDKPPISFAEIIGTTQASKKSTTSEALPRPSTGRSPMDIDVGNFQIVTDVEEIMRIASSNRDTRTIPSNFFQVSTKLIAGEFSVHEATVRERVRIIAKEFPEYFFGGGTGGKPHFASREGLDLLRESLGKITKITEKDYITLQGVAKDLHINTKKLRAHINTLKLEYPDYFQGTGTRWDPYRITKEGLLLLREIPSGKILQKVSQSGEILNHIHTGDLAKEYNISRWQVTYLLGKLISEHPEYYEGGGGAGKYYFASEKGFALLRDTLSSFKS